MEELKKQVKRAQGRLWGAQVLRIASATLFVSLVVCSLGLLLPKVWAFPFLQPTTAQSVWLWSWIGGSVGVGLVVTLSISWMTRRTATEAAIEIDRRFGLKERVSSAFVLDEKQQAADVGKALVNDASRQVKKIDIRDRFSIRPDWKTALPLAPLLAIAVLACFIPNANMETSADAADLDGQTEVKEITERLRLQVAEQKKRLQAGDLKDAEVLFKEIEKQLEEFERGGETSRKKALVKLNDIKHQLEQRQRELGDAAALKQQLSQLKDIKKGPADKIAESLKSGDYQKAADAMQELANKLANQELSEKEKEQLAEQLSQLQKKLADMASEHEKAKQQLEQQIAKAKEDGNNDRAAQLQQELEGMQQQDPQMQQLQDLAMQMGECSKCMGGDGKGSPQQIAQAEQALKDLSEQMQQMQNELDQMEALDQLGEQIGECKGMLNGQPGGGSSKGRGMAQHGMPGDDFGDGYGQGKGTGERGETETETQAYETRVKATPENGESIVMGNAGGANIAGMSRTEAQELVSESIGEETDPLADQRLPRGQQEHAKEYFDRFREGR